MNYTVTLEHRAKHGLKQLAAELRTAVLNTIISLGLDPRPRGAKKLSGADGNRWRLRVRDIRILYTVDDAVESVVIFKIGPRNSVYRKP